MAVLKSIKIKVTLLVLINLLFFLVLEILFRQLLFSDLSFMKPFRQAQFYGDYYSDDDYWKLQYHFKKQAPGHPDLLMGWVKPSLSLGTYEHEMADKVGSRPPVLLYGDSFANCVTSEKECFDGILNENREFSDKMFLVNYGVYGYGLDQIYLLFKQTVDTYQKPKVIVSLLDSDLDRSILTLRDGQKPYFELLQGELHLRGVPIDPDPKRYHAAHPPEISSYLLRMFKRNCIERPLATLGKESKKISEKKKINSAILLKIRQELEVRKIEYTFLVFEKPADIFSLPGWRLKYLTDLFEEEKIPHILARDIILPHSKKMHYDSSMYQFSSKNYHPNSLYNQLVSNALLQWSKTGERSTQSMNNINLHHGQLN